MPSRTPTRSVSRTPRLASRYGRTSNGSLAALIRLEIDGVRMQFCVSRDRVFLIRGFHTPSSQPRKTVRCLGTSRPRPSYRFKCIVCYEECGRDQRHDSGCPSCTVHDTRPVAGEVLARGVCKTCAGIWKKKNNGDEVCVTCNRRVVSDVGPDGDHEGCCSSGAQPSPREHETTH